MFRRLSAVLRPASPAERDSGLGIVEVIVALLVFALVTTGAIAAVATSLRLTADNRGREVAANLAASEIDLARSIKATQLGSRDFTSDPIDGVVYTVRRDVTWATSTGVDSQCAGGAGAGSLFYKRVNVSVTWTGMRLATSAVRADTVVTPEGKVSSSSTGTILVSVKDATGAGVRGTTVTIAPDSSVAGNKAEALELDSRPATTDATGCAFAINVTPGSYTITLSRADGVVYVDDKQATQPVKTVTVGSGGSAAQSFAYARADRYELVWPAGALRASDQPTTFRGASTSVLATAPVDVQYLWPVSSGYQVFAGAYAPGDPKSTSSCLSPDPTLWSPAADGRVGKPIATSVPDYRVGPVVSGVVVPVQAVTVPVTTGDRVVRATSATAAAAAGDPGCAARTVLNFSLPANLSSAVIALPPGTWSFQSGKTVPTLKSGPAPQLTVDPRTAP